MSANPQRQVHGNRKHTTKSTICQESVVQLLNRCSIVEFRLGYCHAVELTDMWCAANDHHVMSFYMPAVPTKRRDIAITRPYLRERVTGT